ncbi:MAG: hypothetical protein AW12_02084 [Candidatus Accumulibacter sp. BA-94]|uniref:hypothetical protein n=1 Tax=Accumulibacter sp. TaxID=2053492 RepID=UPI00044F7A88|nr:hypothetical protein [Accumulibacter sp.]EXI87232.1 MAG: hypothetical protein AW12_02084 [Candidatus Accumulibacter sp. BA-94]MBL8390797.1 hypothetical protein [Accumulibacter sp.]HRD87608.1 hypothetical protein [Accumulibacter sp.]
MKVMMVVEGGDCALRIEPTDEEGLALLAAFGVSGAYQAKLGDAAGSTMLATEWICSSYEGAPAELD